MSGNSGKRFSNACTSNIYEIVSYAEFGILVLSRNAHITWVHVDAGIYLN